MKTLPYFQPDSRIVQFGLFSLVLLFVLCSSTLFHSLGSINASSDMPPGACCVSDSHTSTDANHMSSIVVNSFSNIAVFVALLTVFVSVLLIAGLTLSQTGINYIRSIRDKYGGFRLLNYLQNLFSQGILHSRDFFVLA